MSSLITTRGLGRTAFSLVTDGLGMFAPVGPPSLDDSGNVGVVVLEPTIDLDVLDVELFALLIDAGVDVSDVSSAISVAMLAPTIEVTMLAPSISLTVEVAEEGLEVIDAGLSVSTLSSTTEVIEIQAASSLSPIPEPSITLVEKGGRNT